MATMNVGMTLTLLDTASPQFKSLLGTLASVEAAVASLSAKMATFTSGLTGSSETAGVLGGVIERLNLSSIAASEAMGKLAASSVASSEAMLAQATAGRSVEASLAGASAAATAFGGRMGVVGAETKAATAATSGMGNMLKGMAEIWAALKIEKFAKDSVGVAGDFQASVFGLESLGIGLDRTKELVDKAFDTSKVLKFASVVDALSAKKAMIAGIAEPFDDEKLDQITPKAMQAVRLMQIGGDKTESETMYRNLAGFFELRGHTGDVEAMKRDTDLLLQIFEAEQGKVTLRDMEMFGRRGASEFKSISDEGLRNIATTIGQFKIKGGEGGGGTGGGASQVAVAMRGLVETLLGGPMTKQAAVMLTEAGIFDPGSLVEDDTTHLLRSTKPSGRDVALALENPMALLEKYAPQILAYTLRYRDKFYGDRDPNDPEAMRMAEQKFMAEAGFRQTFQILAAIGMNPSDVAFRKRGVEMQKQSFTTEQGISAADKLYIQQMKDFDASVTQLKQSIGEILLPLLRPLIEGFAELFKTIAGFTRDHPIIGFFGTLGVLLLGVGAAVDGVRRFVGPLLGILKAVGIGGAEAGAGVAAAGAGVAGLMGWLLRFGTWSLSGLAAFGAGWGIGKALGALEIEIDGKTKSIEEIVSRWIESLVNIIHDGWAKTKGWLYELTGGAAQSGEKVGTREVSGKITGLSSGTTSVTAKTDYDTLFDVAAASHLQPYGLGGGFLKTMAQRESGMNPYAVSAAGAQGLMQFMPGTAKEMGLADPFDAGQSITAGAKLMRKLLDQFSGDVDKALLAYNAGPGVVLGTTKQSAANKAQSDAYVAALGTKGAAGAYRDRLAGITTESVTADQIVARNKAVLNPPAPKDNQMTGLEAKLKADQDVFDKEQVMQDSFQKWSIEQTRDYWKKIRDAGNLGAHDKESVDVKFYAAEAAVREKSFRAYIAKLDGEIVALGHNIQAKIAIAEKEYAAEVLHYGKESAQAENAFKKIEQFRGQLADRTMRIAEIETKATEATLLHGFEMGRLRADNDLALRKINNAQRLAIELQYENQAFTQAHAAQQKLIDDEKNGPNDPVKMAEMYRQLSKMDEDYETKKTKLMQQAEQERKKDAIDAANVVQNSTAGLFDALITRSKSLKAAFADWLKSIADGFAKIASDRAAKALLGPGTPGGDFLNKLTGGIFGASDATGGASLTVAGTSLTSAGTLLTTAAGSLQAAAGALGFSGGKGGLPGFGLPDFGLPDFGGIPFIPEFTPILASGTDYVPRDMLAMLHEGERVVPKAFNKGAGHSGSLPAFTQHVHVTGTVDSRSLAQLAAATADGLDRHRARIR